MTHSVWECCGFYFSPTRKLNTTEYFASLWKLWYSVDSCNIPCRYKWISGCTKTTTHTHPYQHPVCLCAEPAWTSFSEHNQALAIHWAVEWCKTEIVQWSRVSMYGARIDDSTVAWAICLSSLSCWLAFFVVNSGHLWAKIQICVCVYASSTYIPVALIDVWRRQGFIQREAKHSVLILAKVQSPQNTYIITVTTPL